MSDYYKTIIQIEVLSEGPYEWDSLWGIYKDTSSGNCSGIVHEVSTAKITEEELVAECGKHGTDPEFFSECE